jgi:hypothetical protein
MDGEKKGRKEGKKEKVVDTVAKKIPRGEKRHISMGYYYWVRKYLSPNNRSQGRRETIGGRERKERRKGNEEEGKGKNMEGG